MNAGDAVSMVVGLIVLAIAIVLVIQLIRVPGAIIQIAEDLREIRRRLENR